MLGKGPLLFDLIFTSVVHYLLRVFVRQKWKKNKITKTTNEFKFEKLISNDPTNLVVLNDDTDQSLKLNSTHNSNSAAFFPLQPCM